MNLVGIEPYLIPAGFASQMAIIENKKTAKTFFNRKKNNFAVLILVELLLL